MGSGHPKPILSLVNAIAIIVGTVVGAGIFRLPSLVAGALESEALILAAWLAGGIISLIGALCFAELATSHPHTGGEYHFLNRAYGRNCGFIFAWARMSVLQTGSIALLAFVAGDYANQILPLGGQGAVLYAALAVIGLTGLNVLGLRQAMSTQTLLFAATLVGLFCVIAGGLTVIGQAENVMPPEIPTAGAGSAAWGMAMIFVLLTYGGWNEAAYISAEVKNGRRNMVVALVASIVLITLLYLAVNFVYLRVLTPEGVAASSAVAHDVMQAAFGNAGGTFIAVLVLVMVLASMNVTIFTGARTNFALGRDFPLFGFLSNWSDRGAPVQALLLQGGIALALVLLGALSRRGIETMVDYLSPVFWLFFLLTGLSVFVLRLREPARERPFRVPLYPLTPALFCLVCAYMLYSSVSYTGIGALAGVAVLALGLPLLLLSRRMPAGAAPSSHSPE
ncbi:APC family permease [Telmatospirillum sp. J64-1]|uniref:APC family permease n=1 Tax=Telmatospirillum sp. J64-1 TaxID=2502183 RepID=UPI00115E8CD0|nr:amino acid permease [Telmatospirillum sp. J64-1]